MTRLISSWLAIAGLFTPWASAQVSQEGGVRNPHDGPPVLALPGLLLSEVSPGPALSYIEVFNGLDVAVDLDGYHVETSTGSFPLDGLVEPLAPGGFFLLLHGNVAEAGVSDDPSVPCIIVSTATCGHISDTVLLRKPSGTLSDAMSYGLAPDPSLRYVEAVSQGQFEAGTFV